MTNLSIDWTSPEKGMSMDNEYYSFISQVGFLHPSQIRLIYESAPQVENQSNFLHLVRLIGLAKIYGLEGNFLQATLSFKKAFELVAKVDDFPTEETPQAFLDYEFGNYLHILGNIEKSRLYFERALSQAKSQKFTDMLRWRIKMFEVEDGTTSAIFSFKRKTISYEHSEMTVLAANGYHRIGNYYWKHGDYELAEDSYNKGLRIAVENGLKYSEWAISNAMGLLKFKSEGPDSAIASFTKLLENVENDYFYTIISKNLSMMHFVKKDIDQSIIHASNAYQRSIEKTIYSDTPVLANLLGDLHREYKKDNRLAFKYYSSAYDSIMEQAEAGIEITPPRARILKNVFSYLVDNVTDLDGQHEDLSAFSFANSKTWTEIKDILTMNIFLYHYLNSGPGEKTFKKLGISSSTFYSSTGRMASRGVKFPNTRKGESLHDSPFLEEKLQKVISKHDGRSLKEVQSTLENLAIEHLFKLHGYNKSKLAKELSLTYSIVVDRTKFLTDTSKTR